VSSAELLKYVIGAQAVGLKLLLIRMNRTSTNERVMKPETLKLLEAAQANKTPVVLTAAAVIEVLELVKLCKQQVWVLERTAKQLEIALAQRSRSDEIT